MSRVGKTSTGMLRNAATPRMIVSSAPTITACGLRNEKPGTVRDLVRSGLERTSAMFPDQSRHAHANVRGDGDSTRMWRLGQWVGCARARRPELEVLQDTEGRDFRNYCQGEEGVRDILDNHRRRNRRLRIDKRNLLYAPGLRSRDESVAYDILAYLGGAKVLAKVMSIRNGEGRQHCHA